MLRNITPLIVCLHGRLTLNTRYARGGPSYALDFVLCNPQMPATNKIFFKCFNNLFTNVVGVAIYTLCVQLSCMAISEADDFFRIETVKTITIFYVLVYIYYRVAPEEIPILNAALELKSFPTPELCYTPLSNLCFSNMLYFLTCPAKEQ